MNTISGVVFAITMIFIGISAMDAGNTFMLFNFMSYLQPVKFLYSIPLKLFIDLFHITKSHFTLSLKTMAANARMLVISMTSDVRSTLKNLPQKASNVIADNLPFIAKAI